MTRKLSQGLIQTKPGRRSRALRNATRDEWHWAVNAMVSLDKIAPQNVNFTAVILSTIVVHNTQP